MISERDISEKFSVIWKQHFPLLTPTFMKVFNESYVKKINSISVPINENVRFDLVSEIAFNLSKTLVKDEVTITKFLKNKNNITSLIQHTIHENHKINASSANAPILTSIELNEIKAICSNILEFIQIEKKERVEFSPILFGYGFIPNLTGDLVVDNSLYEIKTVNRNFKSTDLKQLFIYLALKQSSDKIGWEYAGLYNPRKGTYCKFNVKNLIYNLTGKTTNETFENLLNSLVRDIQIDSRF